MRARPGKLLPQPFDRFRVAFDVEAALDGAAELFGIFLAQYLFELGAGRLDESGGAARVTRHALLQMDDEPALVVGRGEQAGLAFGNAEQHRQRRRRTPGSAGCRH